MNKKDHLRKDEEVSTTNSLVAGSLSGLFARTCIAPLDTVKIKLQVTPHNKNANVLINILKREGIRGFWKGNVPGSIMYIIYGGAQFGSYTYIGSFLRGGLDLNISPQLYSCLVGSLAGMTSSLASYPFDVLRTRFAANSQGQLIKLRDEIMAIWSHEGLMGFFSGCGSSMINIGLNTAIMFGVYESIKIFTEERSKLSDRRDPFTLLNELAGPISGFTSKLATFPLDTVRRRIQIRNSPNEERHDREFTKDIYKSYKNRRFLGVGISMVQQEGPLSLYRGVTMSLIKSVPSTAISLWSYELFMNKLG
ncbi:uncharacterized protein GVI51_G03003 [Nakaseomyces glabratus]|uniref:Mitochondrial thiamine pyrophosphate carrier 1 n=2 Tax=Candida glabrata TaxID=5478 RepID=TPC1_CANGA|nr:uncharacterized protein CAGL0G03135g [Nakaseomyces glabratus]Q6FTE5.1 RecName: Full=Mitochondrial thiamine pyrophosphate carrier 1 [Nakaseomyces glabratus CBS 138]KAH7586802.1 Mitochondrial carrier protein [Nakaseomyces glabratus]KAH7588802.1 Mitochondrial carrier protein [Nakaseomyces glabratus]KAH7593216.1 Mitochondrial carrier protein [Nakaseomyces glabratus]KAH7602252.1 Mitochondrial carrier protein [Nakaseomyces glabratus]KAH7603252.1 Mitochondrial carrier protein [Nakaseomyces glabra|eukprot:XP_446499.1 uncharacterized protein CAGL0G03135g [[Candida] glabrata]